MTISCFVNKSTTSNSCLKSTKSHQIVKLEHLTQKFENYNFVYQPENLIINEISRHMSILKFKAWLSQNHLGMVAIIGMQKRTCSPSFAKLADKIDGETIMSLLENWSTRELALTTDRKFLLKYHNTIKSYKSIHIWWA